MNTTKVCSSGARRAGIWQLLALCGVLIAAGLLGVALATVPSAEARASGPPDDCMVSDFLRAPDASTRGVGASSPADSFPCTGDGVYIYDDINYGGACLRWTADDPELGDDSFHDRASSLRFVGYYASGARATLYEHHSYTGASTTFTAADPWLGDDAIGNDRADSIRIEMVPFCDLVSEIPKVECEALVAFYNSTDGPHWTNRNGWLVTNTPCTTPWVGVQCAGGRVRKLHLFWNGLNGAIPPQLGSLSNLRELYLVDNLQLRGTIPPQLGNLTNLEGLYLSMNQLSGTIPAQLGNLINLQELVLSQNELSGAIPPQLGNLTNLQELGLSQNELSGAIPSQLGNLTNLEVLALSLNQLSGTIPSQLGSLTKLMSLHLGVTALGGAIPPQLGNLTDLRELSLTSTQLNGAIPPQLGNLTKLEWLQLDHSSLSGALPGDMKQFTALKTFHFDHTLLCEPADPAFQAWLASIPDLHSTGVKCPASTVTPTPTVTRTRTPSPTATRTGGSTPSPTPTATRAPLPCSNLLRNGDFEAGLLAPWMTDLQVGLGPGRGIGHGGWLGGAVNAEAELFQEVMIPAPANLGKLTFWWRADAANAQPGDRLAVLIQYGEESDPVWSQAADGAPGQWRRREVDLSAYRGRRVFVTFHAHNDAGVATTFRVDDVDLPICRSGLYLPLVLRNNPAAIPILSDNFNDGDMAGWAPNGGVWQNTGSALRGQRTDGVGYNMRLESGTDFTYEATVTIHSGAAGLTFRSSADGADSDCVALDPAAGRVKFCINGPWWYSASQEMALQYDRAYRLKVVARGASFEVYLDGDKLFTTTSTRHAAGRFGVLVYEGTASFDDVVASSP